MSFFLKRSHFFEKIAIFSISCIIFWSCNQHDGSVPSSVQPSRHGVLHRPTTSIATTSIATTAGVDCTNYLSGGGESGAQELGRLGIDPTNVLDRDRLAHLAKKKVFERIQRLYTQRTQFDGFPNRMGEEALTTLMSMVPQDLTNEINFFTAFIGIAIPDAPLDAQLIRDVRLKIAALPAFPVVHFMAVQPNLYQLNWQRLAFDPYAILRRSKYDVAGLPEVLDPEYDHLKNAFYTVARANDSAALPDITYMLNHLNGLHHGSTPKKSITRKKIKLAYCEAQARGQADLDFIVSLFRARRCIDGTGYLADDALTFLGLGVAGTGANPTTLGDAISRVQSDLLVQNIKEYWHLGVTNEQQTYVPRGIELRLTTPLGLFGALTPLQYPGCAQLNTPSYQPWAVMRKSMAGTPVERRYQLRDDDANYLFPVQYKESTLISPDIFVRKLDEAYRRAFVQGPRKVTTDGMKIRDALVMDLMSTHGAEHLPYLNVISEVYSVYITNFDLNEVVQVSGQDYRVGDFIAGAAVGSPTDIELTDLFWHYVLRFYGWEIPR